MTLLMDIKGMTWTIERGPFSFINRDSQMVEMDAKPRINVLLEIVGEVFFPIGFEAFA